MKKVKLYIISVLIIACACNKTVEPDLCAGKSPTTADFDVYEVYRTEADRKDPLSIGAIYWVNYASDTLMKDVATFIAKQDTSGGVKYEWTIGTIKSDKRKIVVDFSERPIGRDVIPIMLKVTNPNPSPCFRMDDGKSEFTKSIVILRPNIVDYSKYPRPYEQQSKVNGTYVGTYWNLAYPYIPDSLPDGKIYYGDTLRIRMGWGRQDETGCVSSTSTMWYEFSEYKRKKMNPWLRCLPNRRPKDDYWLVLDFSGGILGYKQYESDNRELYNRINIRLTDGKNEIEFKIKGELIFKGKRI